MKAPGFVFGHALLLASCAGHADELRLPSNAPPAYQAECSSCHVAFPPQLLPAADWQRVMANLEEHYGDNAGLDEKTRHNIEAFLVRNAGSPKKIGAGGTVKTGDLPRLTATAWFKRTHHAVRRADWTHVKVKSPANCAACHSKASTGSYREREIVMPDGRPWEDD